MRPPFSPARRASPPLRGRPGSWRKLLIGSTAACWSCAGAQDPTTAALLSLWNRTLDVRTHAGYKDNVTLSAFQPEASGFWLTGLEFWMGRLPPEDTKFQFFLSAEDVRYFESPSVDKEQLVFAFAELQRPVGSAWLGTLKTTYFYQDQILDASITETNLSALHVLGHTLEATPGLRWNCTPTAGWEVTVPVTRQLFDENLDDYWEVGPKLAFARSYGHDSEWRLGASLVYRAYDTRTRATSEGESIPGTSLAYQQPGAEFAWWHRFDAAKRWRNTLKAGFRHNFDNGSGYFDYFKTYLSEELLFRADRWEFALGSQLAFFDYAQQPAGLEPGPTRQRLEWLVTLRAERALTQWLKCYAEFTHEQTLGRERIEEYSVNSLVGGLTWQF